MTDEEREFVAAMKMIAEIADLKKLKRLCDIVDRLDKELSEAKAEIKRLEKLMVDWLSRIQK